MWSVHTSSQLPPQTCNLLFDLNDNLSRSMRPTAVPSSHHRPFSIFTVNLRASPSVHTDRSDVLHAADQTLV